MYVRSNSIIFDVNCKKYIQNLFPLLNISIYNTIYHYYLLKIIYSETNFKIPNLLSRIVIAYNDKILIFSSLANLITDFTNIRKKNRFDNI